MFSCRSVFSPVRRSVAEELPKGMAVVALNPGVINTDMLASSSLSIPRIMGFGGSHQDTQSYTNRQWCFSLYLKSLT